MKILVAEDNPLSQRLMATLLEDLAHQVTIVGDGYAALAQLEVEEFDLVLMDVEMPGLSGLETVERWRQRERPRAHHVPVVALTAHASRADAERCSRAGMNGCLSKPLDVSQLERLLETLGPVATAPEIEGDAPYHPATLERRVGCDAAFLLQLSVIFEARADLLVAKIQSAIAARDSDGVKDAAHELKGMLLNLAATDAYRTVRELEAAGRAARYEAASTYLTRLTTETSKLLQALRARASSYAQHDVAQ